MLDNCVCAFDCKQQRSYHQIACSVRTDSTPENHWTLSALPDTKCKLELFVQRMCKLADSWVLLKENSNSVCEVTWTMCFFVYVVCFETKSYITQAGLQPSFS